MTKRSQRTRSRLTSRSTRTAVRSPSSPYPTRSGSWKRSTRRAWVRSTRRSCARSTRGKSRLWSVHGKDGELIRWLRLESRRRKSNSFRHRMAFLRDRRYSEPGGPEPPKPGARLYGGEGRPDHNDYWMRDEFPFDVLPAMSDLGIAGTPYEGYGCLGKGTLMDGLVTTEPSCPRVSRRKRSPDRLTWAASWPTPRRCTRTRARARSTRFSWGAP